MSDKCDHVYAFRISHGSGRCGILSDMDTGSRSDAHIIRQGVAYDFWYLILQRIQGMPSWINSYELRLIDEQGYS